MSTAAEIIVTFIVAAYLLAVVFCALAVFVAMRAARGPGRDLEPELEENEKEEWT